MIDKDRLADGLYLLTKGVRDCLEMSIVGTPEEINDQLCDIESLATRNDYHVLAFKLHDEELESEGREYHAVFVCKYQYQRVLLTKLFNDIKPHSFIYEYIMGTLLGYSATSMEEFLMKHCIDHMIGKECYDPDGEKEEEVSPVKDQLSEFDKDAWQVLMTLNDNCTPDSDKMNTLTDLLYTDTDDSREKGLVHELSTAVSLIDVNSPNFGICIRILEKYFHVDTEEEKLDVEQYFGRAAGLYAFLNVAASLTPNTLPEEEQLDHIKKFIELNPPKTFPEILIHNNIKSLVNKSLSKEIKISNIKSILHTYLFHKKKAMNKEETKQKGNTNESIDPYRQAIIKLYRDLKHTKTESEFVSILNKFLEKDVCYKGYKNFQQSLQWIIENKYGKEKSFSNNVLYRIKTFLAIGV